MTYPKAAVDAAFQLLPVKMDSRPARVIHAAIGYQETKYLTRVQYGNGPARSYWQFENGKFAAINGVLTHWSTGALAIAVCRSLGVTPERVAVWKAMEANDVLGAAFARLLMYTDPLALPDNSADAWEMYAKRLWRPGKPHPDKWAASWAFGLECVR